MRNVWKYSKDSFVKCLDVVFIILQNKYYDPLSFCFFSIFSNNLQNKKWRHLRDSNSDHWSWSQTRWPLEHYHGPKCSCYLKVKKTYYLNVKYFYFPEDDSMGCGFPGAPAHSTVEFSQDPIRTGTVARYTCDRGFELLGPARRVCSNNGTWVPQGIPFCGKFALWSIFFTIHNLESVPI